MQDELRVRLLGGLEVVGLEPQAVGSRKARLLLARLAVAAGSAVPAEELVRAVWPESAPARSGEQLAVLVSRLRRVLGPDRIERRDAGLVLRCDWLDVAVLEALAEEAVSRVAVGEVGAARAAVHAALQLARGPLLPEAPDVDWALGPRRSVERTIARVRLLAAETALHMGDPQGAADAAAAALDADPYDEQALRLLMSACLASGRGASALTTYERFRRRLLGELGVDPEPSTQRLHLTLLRSGPAKQIAASPSVFAPGRQMELGALSDALARTRGRAQPLVVEVVGEAGIGKSRLLDAFVAQLAGQAVVVLHSRCDELGRDLPLQPIVDALDTALVGLAAEERRAVLGRDVAVLEDLLGDGDSAAPPAGDARQQVFRALAGLVRRLSRRAGGVLVIDDVHLADGASLRWLAYLRSRAGPPLLVVTGRRVEEWTELAPDVTISMGPLPREAAAEVVGAERAEELWERSGGHPLFLTELALAAPDSLPSSVVAAVAARADRAGSAAATLRAAAVLGPVLHLEVLSRATARTLSQVLDDVEDGVRRHLLVDAGSTLRFPHALVREALAAGVIRSRQQWLHRVAADTLAQDPDVDPAVLAHHARLGGDRRLASSALLAAAAVASRRWQHEAALELLCEAATMDATPEVLRRRAQVRLQLNHYAEAAQDAATAYAADPTAASSEVLAWTTYYHDHDFVRAAALADEAAAASGDEVARLRSLALAGRALHSAGSLRLADQRLRAVLDRPATPAVADVRVSLGMLRMHQGRPAEALALTETAEAAVDPLAFAPVVATMMRSLAFALAGRPLDALAALDRCSRLAEERQITRYGGRAENCRGYVLRNLGRLDEAADWNGLGHERGAALGQLEPQAHALLDLADDALERAAPDTALTLLDAAESLESTPHSHLWRHAMRRRLLTCRAWLTTGEAAQAAELADVLLGEAQERQVDRYVVLARLVRECARHASGDTAEPELVAADLSRLPQVAGLDAWRTTAAVADCFGVPAWGELAAVRVSALASMAGDGGDLLRAYAGRHR